MRAAIIEDGVVTNVIVVHHLEDCPGCVEGEGAAIGDNWDGKVFTRPLPVIPPEVVTKQQIAELESVITPRRLREAILTPEGKTWLTSIDQQVATLRGKLPK